MPRTYDTHCLPPVCVRQEEGREGQCDTPALCSGALGDNGSLGPGGYAHYLVVGGVAPFELAGDAFEISGITADNQNHGIRGLGGVHGHRNYSSRVQAART